MPLKMTANLTFTIDGRNETFTGSLDELKQIAEAYQNWYSAAESRDEHARVTSVLLSPAAADAELEAAKRRRTEAYNALVQADSNLDQAGCMYQRAHKADKTRTALATAADRCMAILREAMAKCGR